MSNSLQSDEMYPARLLCPWDSPGKTTGMGCHFLLHCNPHPVVINMSSGELYVAGPSDHGQCLDYGKTLSRPAFGPAQFEDVPRRVCPTVEAWLCLSW